MRTLRTFILDDDGAMRSLLKASVSRAPGLELVGMSDCPLRAGAEMTSLSVDLLLLDIGLPELDGFGFLDSLPRKPAVIVVSGDAVHAAKAFEHGTVDFLYKPFTQERFLKAVHRAMLQLDPGILRPPSPGPGRDGPATILLKAGKNSVVVRLDDIESLQSVGNYVKVHLSEGSVLATITMRGIEELLPADRFVRVHRSWIVAYRAIKAVDAHGVFWRGKRVQFGGSYKRQAQASILERLTAKGLA